MKNMFKSIVVYVTAVLFLVIMSGCESKDNKNEKTSTFNIEEKTKIRLGLAMQPSSGLIMVALKNGYFKRYGLDIEITEFPSGKRALKEGLFKGKVDIASSADVPVAVSMLNGEEFKIVSVIFKADNVNRVVARKDAGISKPSDLKGKKIATQKASAVHFFLNQFLTEHNILEEDINLSFMKAELLPKALAVGKIDAFSMREPYISEAKKLLKDKFIVFEEPGLYPQIDAVVVSSDFIKKSSRGVNGFVKALLDAQRYIEKDPKSAIKIISDKLGVSYSSIEKIWPEVNLSVSLEQSMILLMENISRWAIKNKIVEKQNVSNSLEFIYFIGLEDSNPDAVTILR
ncbi:MAG: NrtA/SsuA/CpmA family ABC transporter substrate-binding protein [Campylobacterota bacterium]|nr:NrtA/SsuA/CpmA family ABC transporter substrate-binding protein [Campylobacterota bacterium]